MDTLSNAEPVISKWKADRVDGTLGELKTTPQRYNLLPYPTYSLLLRKPPHPPLGKDNNQTP